MLRNITLGQFFPGDTIVHRLDPRTKIILTMLYITALFIMRSFAGYIIMLAVLFAALILSKIRIGSVARAIRPILILITLTALINLFVTTGTVMVEFWIFSITHEGLFAAVFMAGRLLMLIVGTFMLTYTTSPIALTDGLEKLLSPLKIVRLPVHELAMMMSIALRFIPTLLEETDKIISAQKARGANFETGGPIKRAKAILPIIIPLFVSSFRRADELAIAMESRCYHGGEGRTRMKTLKMTLRDYAALILGVGMVAVVVWVRN